MVKLDRICREANVKLVFVRSYGLAGFVRVSVKVIIPFFTPNFFARKLMDYCEYYCQWYAKLNYHYFLLVYQEHTIIDSKPDHFLDDLRLNNHGVSQTCHRGRSIVDYSFVILCCLV